MSPAAGAAVPVARAAVAGELRVEVEPAWAFRLPRMHGMDGLTRVHRGVIHRLLHEGELPVLVRVAQLSSGRVLFGAQAAERSAAACAIERMRRALGVDLDLRRFHERFRSDPLIGAAVRADPALRPRGRPDPFEALTWAVTEQLIEYERAAAIQRRMIRSLGRRDAATGLSDAPTAAALAGAAPAQLQSFDLAGARAIALVRAAREVAAGRVELSPAAAPEDQERGWRRLRTIPEIGSWTVEMLAVSGQGRVDQIPAGDLGFVKLVGRMLSGGDPRARATEQQVREAFARFDEWKGLAGIYALRAAGMVKSPISAG